MVVGVYFVWDFGCIGFVSDFFDWQSVYVCLQFNGFVVVVVFVFDYIDNVGFVDVCGDFVYIEVFQEFGNFVGGVNGFVEYFGIFVEIVVLCSDFISQICKVVDDGYMEFFGKGNQCGVYVVLGCKLF